MKIRYMMYAALALAMGALTGCDNDKAMPPLVMPEYGSGTAEDPYTVPGAYTWVSTGQYENPDDPNYGKKVYVSGRVQSIQEIDTSSYGNAIYFIEPTDGDYDVTVEIYRGYGPGGQKFTSTSQLKVGDEVTVYGSLVLFGSTVEFESGSKIYCLNGEFFDVGDTGGGGGGGGSTTTATPTGDGTVASPYNVARALEIINAGQASDAAVYVEGTVSAITEIGTGYGNATYDIVDEGFTAALTIYRGKGLGGEKIENSDYLKVGDKVVVCGTLVLFYSTPEMTTGSTIYSLNGVTAGGDTPDTPDTPTGTVIYSGLTNNADGWTFDDGPLPEGLTYVWAWSDKYGLKASAYLNQPYATIAMAYTSIDCDGYTGMSLTFQHAYRYTSNPSNDFVVIVREQGNRDWTSLTVPQFGTGADWTFVSSGTIDLSAWAGKKIDLGFRYLSTANEAGTWEIKDFVVTGTK